jgi:hypothetical protein
MAKTSAMLLAGGVLLGATIAHADPPGPGVLPLQVIAIQSDDADDQADALTAALRSRVRALHGFSLAEGDYALEVLTLGFKCGETPDEACQARIADHIHADRYIWGTLKRSKTSRQVTADLHFWSRGRPPIRSQSIYSDNLTTPGDDVLKRLADDMLAKLLQSRKAPQGPTPSPAAAPASAPPLAGTVALTGRSTAAPSSGGDEPVEERSNSGRRTAGWAGIGLGGVLLGAGLYSVVRVHDIDTNDRFDLYRQGFPPGDDICDKARAGTSSKIVGAATPTEMQDLCSEATTFQMLQYVFFGLGAVSAGAGVYLLATDKGAPAPAAQSSWKVAPSVSRSGGRLELKVTF